jgi:hypothetical protein
MLPKMSFMESKKNYILVTEGQREDLRTQHEFQKRYMQLKIP